MDIMARARQSTECNAWMARLGVEGEGEGEAWTARQRVHGEVFLV